MEPDSDVRTENPLAVARGICIGFVCSIPLWALLYAAMRLGCWLRGH